MSVLYDVVEHWTGRLTFTLKLNGATFDGTGYTVQDCFLISATGNRVNMATKFGWATQASGIAYIDPADGDLKAAESPYTVRFQIRDAASKDVFFPNEEPEKIKVRVP